MAIGASAANVGFLLCCARSMGTGNVALFLRFGFYFCGIAALGILGCTTEGDASLDDLVNVVATKIIVHNDKLTD